MMFVHHTGDTIEPEAIKHVYVHPESEIRKQKAEHFMLAIIEEARIPLIMSASATFMEVKVVRTIIHIDTMPKRSAIGKHSTRKHDLPIKNVFTSMGMNHIKKYGKTQFVCLVNERFQFFRCTCANTISALSIRSRGGQRHTEARRSSKEIGDLIAECCRKACQSKLQHTGHKRTYRRSMRAP